VQNITIRNCKIVYEKGTSFPTQVFPINFKGSLYSLAGSLENNILGIFFPTLNYSTLEKLFFKSQYRLDCDLLLGWNNGYLICVFPSSKNSPKWEVPESQSNPFVHWGNDLLQSFFWHSSFPALCQCRCMSLHFAVMDNKCAQSSSLVAA